MAILAQLYLWILGFVLLSNKMLGVDLGINLDILTAGTGLAYLVTGILTLMVFSDDFSDKDSYKFFARFHAATRPQQFEQAIRVAFGAAILLVTHHEIVAGIVVFSHMVTSYVTGATYRHCKKRGWSLEEDE